MTEDKNLRAEKPTGVLITQDMIDLARESIDYEERELIELPAWLRFPGIHFLLSVVMLLAYLLGLGKGYDISGRRAQAGKIDQQQETEVVQDSGSEQPAPPDSKE